MVAAAPMRCKGRGGRASRGRWWFPALPGLFAPKCGSCAGAAQPGGGCVEVCVVVCVARRYQEQCTQCGEHGAARPCAVKRGVAAPAVAVGEADGGKEAKEADDDADACMMLVWVVSSPRHHHMRTQHCKHGIV